MEKIPAVAYLLFLSFLWPVQNINGQPSSAYIFRLGNDTVAYEQYARTKDSIEGDILSLSPRVTLMHFKVIIGGNGNIKSLEASSYYPVKGQFGAPFMERKCTIEDTLVKQEFSRNGKRDTLFSGNFKVTPGAVPALENDIAMFEQMIKQAVLLEGDSIAIQRFTNGPMNSYIKKGENGTYESKVFFFPVYLKTDAGNKVISLDATATTIKTIAGRIPVFDFKKLASAYAAKEEQEGALGLLSPSDTIKAAFKNTDFQITYGRPLKRGREIFGNIVPWNRVWRLGANFATHFSTSRDLLFGEFLLPAGRYTLWMKPGQDSTQLVINKAVNIFGTQYDKNKDLTRLPMIISRLPKVVEQLTIRINETGEGGEIMVQWDLMQAVIPFRVK